MDQINIFLRKILEGGDDGGVAAVRKAIDLYTSCVNTAQIDALGAQPMINLLNNTGRLVLFQQHTNKNHVTFKPLHESY